MIVVISGAASNAGSNLILLASSGKLHPNRLDKTTIQIIESETAIAIHNAWGSEEKYII